MSSLFQWRKVRKCDMMVWILFWSPSCVVKQFASQCPDVKHYQDGNVSLRINCVTSYDHPVSKSSSALAAGMCFWGQPEHSTHVSMVTEALTPQHAHRHTLRLLLSSPKSFQLSYDVLSFILALVLQQTQCQTTQAAWIYHLGLFEVPFDISYYILTFSEFIKKQALYQSHNIKYKYGKKGTFYQNVQQL